jgi:hypothetical protein
MFLLEISIKHFRNHIRLDDKYLKNSKMKAFVLPSVTI